MRTGAFEKIDSGNSLPSGHPLIHSSIDTALPEPCSNEVRCSGSMTFSTRSLEKNTPAYGSADTPEPESAVISFRFLGRK